MGETLGETLGWRQYKWKGSISIHLLIKTKIKWSSTSAQGIFPLYILLLFNWHNTLKTQIEKENVSSVISALMFSKMSVSYLVHTRCIPIMMDINILFSKSPAQLVQKKAKWKMKIFIQNESIM